MTLELGLIVVAWVLVAVLAAAKRSSDRALSEARAAVTMQAQEHTVRRRSVKTVHFGMRERGRMLHLAVRGGVDIVEVRIAGEVVARGRWWPELPEQLQERLRAVELEPWELLEIDLENRGDAEIDACVLCVAEGRLN
ncbi:MAG: hypothetical protein KIT41_14305 [Pyrinomonadaceae bacterium]|nr:hypothetical protein [Pyrinomonadaceae bacterium]